MSGSSWAHRFYGDRAMNGRKLVYSWTCSKCGASGSVPAHPAEPVTTLVVRAAVEHTLNSDCTPGFVSFSRKHCTFTDLVIKTGLPARR
jgi:hypothetical protein